MNNLKAIFKYAWLATKHKYFVFKAGLKLKVPIRLLLLHDISKFSLKELPHYGRQFFGDKSQPEKFSVAWLHHQNSNPHHWEYWIQRTGHDKSEGDSLILDMPEIYIREMISDWMGASRAYDGKWPSPGNWPWMESENSSFRKVKVSIKTRERIKEILNGLGFEI